MNQHTPRVAMLILAAGTVGIAAASTPTKQPRKAMDAPAGHPTIDFMPLTPQPKDPTAVLFAEPSTEGVVPPNQIVIAPLSKLESGVYVNFESTPVMPLAMSGNRLLVTNVPANTLEVLRTDAGSGNQLMVERTIPVGIDPVAVAIEPGSGDQIAWVSNYVGDSINIVNINTGETLDIIEAGDEPSSIVFSGDGSTAYIVFEGAAPTTDGEFIDPTPALGVYDVSSHTLISWVDLPADTPRGLAIDTNTNTIYVASLHSGNNTTVVGEPISHVFSNGSTQLISSLASIRDFSLTSSAFASSSMAPYPPITTVPNAPETNIIISDHDPEWHTILAILEYANGDPDPAVVTQYATENHMAFDDAKFVIQHIIDDVKDTTDNDIIVLDANSPQSPIISQIIPNTGTILTDIALRPGSDELFVANLEALNTVRHEPNLNGHFFDHELVRVSTTNPSNITAKNLHDGIPNFDDTSNPNPDAYRNSLANPVDIAFTPNGSRAVIAALGPGRIGLFDAVNMQVLDRVDVGKGTRGVILDQAGTRAYAYNRTDNSVAAVDIAADVLTLSDTLALFNPESPTIVDGRNFLYSTEFSVNNANSCAMCHVDGHLDGLAWDLGDPDGTLGPAPSNMIDSNTGLPLMNHPAKGPMVTMSLRGLKDHNGYHWRGDKPQFEDFNGAFASLLGGTELSESEMTAYRQFIDTIVYPPNPFYDRDNSFKDPRAVNGALHYIVNCNACHALSDDGSLRLAGSVDDAGLELSSLKGQIQIMTQLRAIHRKFDMDQYSGFGLIHDGREERETNAHPIDTFLNTFFPTIPAADHNDVIAFLNAFQTNVMSIVGWEVRLDQSTQPLVSGDIDLMIARAQSNPSFSLEPICDVIAHGTINGIEQSFAYIPASVPGTGGVGPIIPPGQTGSTSTFGNINNTGSNHTGIGHPGVRPGHFVDDAGTSYGIQELRDLAAAPGNHLDFQAVPFRSGYRIAIDQDQDGLQSAQDPFPFKSPDMNQDGIVNATDLALYLTLFANQDPQADYNGDRVINAIDSAAFMVEYNATS